MLNKLKYIFRYSALVSSYVEVSQMCIPPPNTIIWKYHPQQILPIGFNAEKVCVDDHHEISEQKTGNDGTHYVLWKPTTPRSWWILDRVEENKKGTLDYVRKFRCRDESCAICTYVSL